MLKCTPAGTSCHFDRYSWIYVSFRPLFVKHNRIARSSRLRNRMVYYCNQERAKRVVNSTKRRNIELVNSLKFDFARSEGLYTIIKEWQPTRAEQFEIRTSSLSNNCENQNLCVLTGSQNLCVLTCSIRGGVDINRLVHITQITGSVILEYHVTALFLRS